MTRRPLTTRHVAGLVEIAKSKTRSLTDTQLRHAIGAYATNVILSLEGRDLISWRLPLERVYTIGYRGWVLTAHGEDVIQELADERVRRYRA